MNSVEKYLKEKDVEYKKHEHPPVYTCEEAEKYCKDIPGTASKNLLLRDDKKKRYFLIISPDYKQTDLKKLAEIVDVKRITFASSKDLKEKLDLEPGSVSPFGLINDTDKQVEVYIDINIYNSEIVSFHPNENTATLELTQEMFRKYLGSLKHQINAIEL